ncbi:MAG: type II toxin-antitoxin system VapC family toxin [Solirubrobacterales bacterium]|nr:type II toxin-antitoxin system VapC family toxin [Solirubrobacterales bacterium]
MVVDTSALAAILFDEPDRPDLVRRLAAAPRRLISAGTVLEASLVIEGRRGEHAGRELDLLLHRAAVKTVPVDDEQAQLARAGWRRYGKGRHPAGLNYGDLFAYALARQTGDELLFKGEDFSRTDLGTR